MQQGPFDQSNVKCYEPVGCCPLDPCKVTEDDFICAVRTLLPEGPVFNPALASEPPPDPPPVPGVGCFTVGCTPVCDGSAIVEEACTDTPQQMQINTIDSYAATAFTALQAYCCMLKELDPCTAVTTVDRWLERYGVRRSACDPTWSDELKSLLLCLLSRLSNNFVLNKKNLESIAAYFGVEVKIYNAGDFNCSGIPGMWTLDRQRERGGTPTGCAPVDSCDTGEVIGPLPSLVPLARSCATLPSIDIVACQAETVVPTNCLLPGTGGLVEPSAPLYDAFFWLMERVVPSNADICFYRCEDTPCGEIV